MFWYGLFGLILLNFFAFAISLVKPFRTALRIDKEPIPQDQRDRKAQKILEPALEGQADPPKKSQRMLQFLGQICLGLMAGLIVTWIIKLFLRRFGG
jgi:hypothetical protein